MRGTYDAARIAKMLAGRLAVIPPLEVRFWAKVNKNGPVFGDLGPCWLWTAAKNNKGYGNFGKVVNGKTVMLCAHRVAWELSGRELPNKRRDGLVLDHICRTPLCVNPDHLRVVTQAANCTVLAIGAPAGINALKTECKRGHPLSGENLARILVRNGPKTAWRPTRVCLTCWPSNANHKRRFYLMEDGPFRATA